MLKKYLVDIPVSLFALFLFSPVLLVVGIAVFLSMGAPIFFRQERAGLDGRPFRIYKFRTMRDGTEPDAERLTTVGRVLRSTSLDELPELLNVLRGEMSLVGPRPLPTKYLPRYSARQARRHEVRPGITGLAQVSGRNGLGWEERLETDVQYVDNGGLFMDLRILFRTVISVVRREGISEEGSETMSEFLGSAADETVPQATQPVPTTSTPAAPIIARANRSGKAKQAVG